MPIYGKYDDGAVFPLLFMENNTHFREKMTFFIFRFVTFPGRIIAHGKEDNKKY